MKITIKDTEHAKIYYPQLIGKTFENCKDLEYNNFIEIPQQKDEGSQWIIIKDDCTILKNQSILYEVKNINSYLSKIDIILNKYTSEYLYEIRKSLKEIKQQYNDMLRSNE